MKDKNNYYKTNGFLRFLRFLNLLEPEANVLSISKTFMWAMLVIMVFVLFYMPANIDVILSAIAVTAGSMMNYSYRRWIQYRREVTGKDIPDDHENFDIGMVNVSQRSDFNNDIDSPEGDR